MNNINEIRNAVESIYAKLNNWVSEGSIPLLDKAYPNHDGIADHEAIADMMLLRQSLNSLSNACQLGIENLSRIVDRENTVYYIMMRCGADVFHEKFVYTENDVENGGSVDGGENFAFDSWQEAKTQMNVLQSYCNEKGYTNINFRIIEDEG